MPKTIIVPVVTQVVSGVVQVEYSASVIGPPHFSYGADYKVNISISVGANLTAWKNKVIAEVAEKGVTIVGADVIMFGVPS